MIQLTATQQRVLDFVRESVIKNGFAPTRQEIASHFEWKSANAAHDVLKALHNKGRIDLSANKSRAIRIL